GLAAGMLVAGHESTVAQIEFGLLAMFRHPQQRERHSLPLLTRPRPEEGNATKFHRLTSFGGLAIGQVRELRSSRDVQTFLCKLTKHHHTS
ncbi:MAG: hypothetical protein E5X58_25880, partial [Mesorhizobium sp.]